MSFGWELDVSGGNLGRTRTEEESGSSAVQAVECGRGGGSVQGAGPHVAYDRDGLEERRQGGAAVSAACDTCGGHPPTLEPEQRYVVVRALHRCCKRSPEAPRGPPSQAIRLGQETNKELR